MEKSYSAIAILFLVLAVFSRVEGQEKPFEVSPKRVEAILVSDPQSPLQITGPVKVIGFSNGGFYFGYNWTNVSSSAVESFVVKQMSWLGNTTYSIPYVYKKNQGLGPKQIEFSLPERVINDLVPFDDAIAKRAGIGRPANRFWLIMVTEVKLTDGTTFDASERFNRLAAFCTSLRDELSEQKMTGMEVRLRNFVATLQNGPVK